MKDIFIDSFKYNIEKEKYLYIINKNKKNFIIKRIEKNKNIVFITINNDNVIIENIKYINGKKIKCELDNMEKDYLINDIFNVLNEVYIIKDFIDLKELLSKIKESYNNYLICDNRIALSSRSINCNLIDIVLLESNSIIGNIKIADDIDVNVDDYYLENALNLLKNYFLLFKQNGIKYIKKLK